MQHLGFSPQCAQTFALSQSAASSAFAQRRNVTSKHQLRLEPCGWVAWRHKTRPSLVGEKLREQIGR